MTQTNYDIFAKLKDVFEEYRKSLVDLVNTIKDYIDNVLYQTNQVFSKEYSYYDLFLNICFLLIILFITVILYWDYVYRTASKYSRCGTIKEIIDQNIIVRNPFIYNIVIINKNNMNELMDKYVMMIEYNFLKKTTTLHFNEPEYFDPVKNTSISKPFYYYDITNTYKQEIPNIDNEIITSINYEYIPVNNQNEIIKTDAGKNLAQFVRDYGRNPDTFLYPIYDIVNAVEQNKNKIL